MRHAVDASASNTIARLREESEAIRRAADVVEFKVTLGGSVTTAEGEPAAKVSIHVRTRVGDEAAHVPHANQRLLAGLNAGRCDEDGKFRFDFRVTVPRGTEKIEFIVFGRPDAALMSSTIGAAEFTLRNGATRDDLRVQLPAFAQIKGRVVDVDGRGVARAEISFIRAGAGGGFLGSLTADENGVFAKDDIEPADYTIVACNNGHYSEALLVRAALGQRMSLPDMILRAGSVLVVQLNGAGVNVSGQFVRLAWFGDTGELLGQTDARTNSEGEVHFAHVPAGPLQFVIRCARCNPTPQLAVRLVSGETYHYGAVTLTAIEK